MTGLETGTGIGTGMGSGSMNQDDASVDLRSVLGQHRSSSTRGAEGAGEGGAGGSRSTEVAASVLGSFDDSPRPGAGAGPARKGPGAAHLTAELDAEPEVLPVTRRAQRQARRERRRAAHQLRRRREREQGVVTPFRSPWRVQGALSLKIADFGLSQTIGENERLVKRAGSWAYMPCEAVRGNREGYTCKFDVFSFGVCLYVACAAAHPFDPDGNLPVDEIKRRAKHAEWGFQDVSWPHRSRELRDFLTRLITKYPKDRLSSEEALQHPWVLGTRLRAAPVPLMMVATVSESAQGVEASGDSSGETTSGIEVGSARVGGGGGSGSGIEMGGARVVAGGEVEVEMGAPMHLLGDRVTGVREDRGGSEIDPILGEDGVARSRSLRSEGRGVAQVRRGVGSTPRGGGVTSH